ncbi:MAG TPA: hypothetical protein VEX15_13315 [Nocardioidaceae bacterium]|nr:hypothetical protein [Nocardioidaceae bacterium]
MSNDRPEDVDAAFARLVAGYDTDPDAPADGDDEERPWPAAEDVHEPADPHPPPGEPPEADEPDIPIGAGLVISSTDPLNTEATWEDEGHFVPPSPPPIPRLEPLMLLAWVGVLGSIAVAVFATLVGWVIPRLLLLAMVVGFIGGIVVLIARISRDPTDPDHPDDGAVV